MTARVTKALCDFCGRYALTRPHGTEGDRSCSTCDLEDDPGDSAARFWGPILDAKASKTKKGKG